MIMVTRKLMNKSVLYIKIVARVGRLKELVNVGGIQATSKTNQDIEYKRVSFSVCPEIATH